jgi:anti-anti-sigma factor
LPEQPVVSRPSHLRLVPELRRPEPDNLRIRAWRDGGDARLDVVGRLDGRSAAALGDALTRAEAGDTQCVVLDLSHVEAIDSAAVRVIVDSHRRLDGTRALLLIRGRRTVQRQFELAGADEYLYFLD